MRTGAVLAVLTALGIIAYAAGQDGKAPPATLAPAAAPAKPYEMPPELAVNVVTVEWSRQGFGVVAVANVTIKNENGYGVKDIGLECKFFGKSGTEIVRNKKLIYDTIPANKRRTFPAVNIGFVSDQAHSGSCIVASAQKQ